MLNITSVSAAMTAHVDSPGVRVPPLLWYAGAVFLGVLLDRRWPMQIDSGPLTMTAGGLFAIGWLALAFPSIAGFRRMGTSLITIRPAAALVWSGPYQFTRNPMYISLAFLVIACGLFLATWWPIALLIPTLAIVQQFVILPEERYLRRRFGANYAVYFGCVRRWL